MIGPFIYFPQDHSGRTTVTYPFSRAQSIIVPTKKKTLQTSDQKTVFSPLAESTYRHQANIDDEVVTMEILDTAGQVRETLLESFVVNILV